MTDQAEGLRRLLAPRGPRVLAAASGGRRAGASTVTAHLAVALSRRGRSVLVLDEQGGTRGAAALLGCRPRASLGDSLAGRAPVESALAEAMPGLKVMAAGDAANGLRFPADNDALSDAVEKAVPVLDFILIDSGPAPGSQRVALAAAAPEMIVVLGGQASSLKEGYALVKLMHRAYARQQFQVVLTRAAETEADTQIANFVHTCKRYLGVEPLRLGYVPRDDRIEDAGRLTRPIAGISPESPIAAAFRAMAEQLENVRDPIPEAGHGHPLVRLLTHSHRLPSPTAGAIFQ